LTRYRTIVADPPWRYTNKADGVKELGASKAERARRYHTMRTEDMARLPVADLADERAHLYVWVTNPVLTEQRQSIIGDLTAPALIRAWGFEPRSLVTWVKAGPPGLGFYWRGNTEHVIFATRGDAKVPVERRLRNHFESPRRGHSEKPDLFLDLVEQVSDGPYVEMFARRARFGWDYWGDQSLGTAEMPGAAA
jgi:N6-adenosine-specific RNA methylase IME4